MTARTDIAHETMTARLRAAQADEAGLLTDLALSAKASWGYDADFMARCRDVMTISPDAVARHPHYLVEDDSGEVLGFYGFDLTDGLLSLDWLFVRPAFQGYGLGRRLFDHAIAVAKASGFQYFQIISDPHAEAFYLHLGATRCGSVPSDLQPERFLPLLRLDLGPVPRHIR